MIRLPLGARVRVTVLAVAAFVFTLFILSTGLKSLLAKAESAERKVSPSVSGKSMAAKKPVALSAPAITYTPTIFTDPPITGGVNTANGVITGGAGAGQVSLRSAIFAANANPGADIITLGTGTYQLQIAPVLDSGSARKTAYDAGTGLDLNGSFDIEDDLTINGAGQGQTFVDGGSLDLVFSVNSFILNTNNSVKGSGVAMTFNNLTIQHGSNASTDGGNGYSSGGAIWWESGYINGIAQNNGSLTLTNVTLDHNTSPHGGGASGIVLFNAGAINITNCIFSNNTNSGGGAGGGTLAITNSNTNPNAGQNGTVVITGTSFTGNTSAGLGGAIEYIGGKNSYSVAIHGGSITNNTATFGGGIAFQQPPATGFTIDQGMTISGNQAIGGSGFVGSGGGIYGPGNIAIAAGTVITNNSATGNGGGVLLGSGGSITRSTITGNTAGKTGGGIYINSTNVNFSGVNVSLAAPSVTFNRITGNTAPGGGNQIDTNNVTATIGDNWFGTNLPSVDDLGANDAVPIASIGPESPEPGAGNPTTQSTTPNVNATTQSPNAFASGQSVTIAGTPAQLVSGSLVTYDGVATCPNFAIPPQPQNGITATSSTQFSFCSPQTAGAPTFPATSGGEVSTESSVVAASESGTTVTITVTHALPPSGLFTGAPDIPHKLVVGQPVRIAGINSGPNTAGYNGEFIVTSVPTATTFTYTAPAGLANVADNNNAPIGIAIPLRNNITHASESGSTVTLTLDAAAGSATTSYNFAVGNLIAVAGVSASGYNGTAIVTAVSGSTITYTASTAGLAAVGAGGNVSKLVDSLLQLNHTASPSKIKINQSSALTASFLLDSANNAVSTTNLSTIIGRTITFGNAVDGSITGAQGTIQANGTATATFNAGSVAGGGKADATVDSGTDTADIVVLQPPSITKSFSPTSVISTNPSTVTFSINNPNVVTINGSFTDTLPANLAVAPTPSVVNNCGGSVTAVAGSGSISFSNASSLPLGVCTIQVNVKAAVNGIYTNSVTIDSTDAGNGNTSSADLTVIDPPSIVKSFSPTTIAANTSTTLSFMISNPNPSLSITQAGFTDSLPTGLVVAAAPNVTGSCGGGTISAPAGSASVVLSGGTLTGGASCTFSVSVTGTTAGVKNNSVQVISANAGTGNTSNASVTVIGPPTISKSFNPTSVALNASSTLSFTITNPNTVSALSGVGFTDSLPAGVVVAATPSITGSCGSGTITASAGSSVISLSGGTLTASPAAGSSCTFSVSVTGTSAGAKSNTTGAITSTEGGTGSTSNAATLTVVAPPAIAKVFNPTQILLNATTSLQFTITNPVANTVALTGVAFSDTLPTGLTVASATSSPCGGTLTTTAPTGIALTGATVAANGTCQFNVTVTGAVAGQYTNTTGAVSSTNGGTGNTATANLSVGTPPTITKSFGAANIAVNTNTTLSFTISNPNASLTLTGIGFTDSLQAGLVVASSNGLTGSCGGGTITATGGGSSVSLSGATLASNASCTFSVNVTGTTAGVKNNSVQVTSTEAGAGNTSNASLTVVGPPTIHKAFSVGSIPLNGSTTLTLSLTNPNTASPLSGVGFTDTLPAGLVVATPNNLTGNCGGGTVTAVGGSGSISLTGGALTASPAAGSSCTITVDVTGTAAGDQSNTTGAVTSTEGGTGAVSNTAVLTVVAPPSIAKVFSPSQISLNATTSLQFTITNPAGNTVSLTGVAFTDTLPTGLTVTTASASACGGTLTTTAPTGITLTGATVAVNTPCQFSVTVTGAASGLYTNTTGAVSSTNGGTGNTATANLSVATPPTITKSFGAASIAVNTNTTLSFTITNPNTSLTLTGVGFTDSLAAGLVVASPPGLTGSCGGGTITATGGSSSVSLAGATLASGASCTFSVSVTGTTAGVKNNSVTVTSTEGGPGNTSNASVTVVAPPTISKGFGAVSIPLSGGLATLTFNLTNPNTTGPLSGVGFSDSLPSGLIVATPNGLSGSCGGGSITALGGSSSVSLTGATLASSGSCAFAVNVTGTSAGTKTNTSGQVTSTEGGTGGTATATIDVLAPPVISKSFGAATLTPNGTTSLNFTIINPAPNGLNLTGVGFTDTLPSGLVISTPNGLTGSCGGGTITATAGSTSISVSNASITPQVGGSAPSGGVIVNGVRKQATPLITNSGGPCVFSVNVTATSLGSKVNTTSAVTSTNGGTGNTATASLLVGHPVPTTSSLSPSSATMGNAGFVLTVNGTGFDSSSVVNWNGSPRATSLVSDTQVTAVIPFTDIASIVAVSVTVVNPTPGGGTSNAQTFTINFPVCAPLLPTATHLYRAELSALDSIGTQDGLFDPSIFTAGKVGKAFSFNGNNNVVKLPTNFIPYPTTGKTATTPISVEAWFKTTSGGVIFGQQDSPINFNGHPNSGWIPAIYVGQDGRLYANLFEDGTGTLTPLSSPATVNDGVFHRVAVTYDGATETLYLDGLAVGSKLLVQHGYGKNYSYEIGTGFTGFGVKGNWPGTAGGWYTFNGQVDELAIYSQALTADQVLANYNGGSAGQCFQAPTITNLTPAQTVVGNAAPLVFINGSGFYSGSVVMVNGNAHASNYSGGTQMSIQLTAAEVSAVGTLTITVVNPSPGGGVSNQALFQVTPRVAASRIMR